MFLLSAQHREVVFFKAYADLKVEASRYYLSFLWWLLHPILSMTVYYIVFDVVLQRGTEDYVPFLSIGIIIWHWFSNTITHSMGSILGSGNLMAQIDIPKIVFPCIVMVLDTIKFLFVFFVLLVFLGVYGFTPSLTFLALPLILLVQFLVIMVGAYIVAAIVPFLPDLRFLIEVLLRLTFFLSGVFFPGNMVPAPYQTYFYLNPMANLIENYRNILMYHAWPDWVTLGIIGIGAFISVCAVRYVIMRYDRLYPRICLS